MTLFEITEAMHKAMESVRKKPMVNLPPGSDNYSVKFMRLHCPIGQTAVIKLGNITVH